MSRQHVRYLIEEEALHNYWSNEDVWWNMSQDESDWSDQYSDHYYYGQDVYRPELGRQTPMTECENSASEDEEYSEEEEYSEDPLEESEEYFNARQSEHLQSSSDPSDTTDNIDDNALHNYWADQNVLSQLNRERDEWSNQYSDVYHFGQEVYYSNHRLAPQPPMPECDNSESQEEVYSDENYSEATEDEYQSCRKSWDDIDAKFKAYMHYLDQKYGQPSECDISGSEDDMTQRYDSYEEYSEEDDYTSEQSEDVFNSVPIVPTLVSTLEWQSNQSHSSTSLDWEQPQYPEYEDYSEEIRREVRTIDDDIDSAFQEYMESLDRMNTRSPT